MKIVDNRTTKTSIMVNSEDIKVGIYFMGRINECNGLFLRIYEGVVFIDDPAYTWNGSCDVNEYEPIEVEIHIERNL